LERNPRSIAARHLRSSSIFSNFGYRFLTRSIYIYICTNREGKKSFIFRGKSIFDYSRRETNEDGGGVPPPFRNQTEAAGEKSFVQKSLVFLLLCNLEALFSPQKMECLELFRRQYLQLLPLEQLAFPPAHLLKAASVQAWLYEKLFKEEAGTFVGADTSNERRHYVLPSRYKTKVLKAIISRLEASISESNKNDDEVGDNYDVCFCGTDFFFKDVMERQENIPTKMPIV
jgi:hypothetical protein